MTNFIAWSLLVIGFVHMLYGVLRFSRPVRRHFCINTAAKGDFDAIRLMGTYLPVGSLIGLAALPKSPFIVGLVVPLFVMAVVC
jgi:hypothetical protein